MLVFFSTRQRYEFVSSQTTADALWFNAQDIAQVPARKASRIFGRTKKGSIYRYSVTDFFRAAHIMVEAQVSDAAWVSLLAVELGLALWSEE